MVGRVGEVKIREVNGVDGMVVIEVIDETDEVGGVTRVVVADRVDEVEIR